MNAEKSEKRKRVAHVLKSSIYSGAENVVMTIIRELKDEFEFVYIATDGPIREKLEQENVTYILLKEFNRRNLNKAIQDFSPDIIHAHDFSATVMCGTLSGRFRLISHLHYDPPWSRKWNVKTVAYWVISNRVEQILAVSQGAYNNFAFAKILSEKTVIIGNPIDKIRILRMGGKEEEKKYDLLFVGRFVEQKNPLAFIEIINTLKKSGKNIKAAMVGTGEMETECKCLIKKYKLENEIQLLGFQKNPYYYMKISRLLCMTSKWEGYGLVAVEANVLGIPVLSTKTGGVTDIFGEKADELCEGVDVFVEKIINLLNDSMEYKKWCEKVAIRQKSFREQAVYISNLNSIYKKDMENK